MKCCVVLCSLVLCSVVLCSVVLYSVLKVIKSSERNMLKNVARIIKKVIGKSLEKCFKIMRRAEQALRIGERKEL